MSIFARMSEHGHEQLMFMRDGVSGLRSLIAIHDTTLGGALGGCRMYPYEREEEVIDDALKLSLGMTAKSAVTGCNHGGGKAVIWGDPESEKSEALFRAFGRYVESLRGRFVTGTDMGTTYEDFVISSEETKWLVGLPEYAGGSGNTSITTAYGVFWGLRAAARHTWGSDDLAGSRILVQGVGKVGSRLTEHLVNSGCEVVVTDVDDARVGQIVSRYGVESVPPEAAYDTEGDFFAPCALGGILNHDTVDRLRVRVVGGAANNQLADVETGRTLFERGILYVPDYIINAGGLIQVADELDGYDRERVMRKTRGLYDLLLRCLSLADELEIPPFEAADRMVVDRIDRLSGINRIYLPR